MLARRTVSCIQRVCIRRVSSQPASLPPEFEALLVDEDPPVFSLDDVVGHVAPPVPIQWKSPSPRKGPQEVVRELRAALTVSGVVGALALLRENAHTPYPRLVAHAVVHSLLRAGEHLRAGAFLNAFATERTAVKLPRVHPTTLSKTIGALIALVPKTQGRQDRVRTAQRPALLRIQASMVSEPALRTALSLYLQARNLFVPRKRKDAAMILDALFRQREWIPAALMFELQVKDHQLRRSIPFLLRAEDPAAPPLNPHDRHHLRRRLAVLQIEKSRVSPAFFADLCFRIAGVLSSLTNRPASPYYAATEEIPALAPGPRTPLTPQRAQHHARLALQALAILGTLIKTRQIPFGNVNSWIVTVGSA
ncbi:hypothetical protein C8R47DRAFT_670700 [Mycena vitilis]|nr:hypothetical protein C8R47DRAFT_670700 [Mycena vitilis]